MTGIVDYNAGNIRSVELALLSLGVEYRISKKPADLASADRLIFPGVGEARFAMKELKSSDLTPSSANGRPRANLCSASASDPRLSSNIPKRATRPASALIAGTVRHFPLNFRNRGLKVPHMGWNDIGYHNGGSSLFDGVKEHSDFYFVHSYYIDPSDPSVISASVDYGMNVPCAVKKGNIEAVQFHPEKSGENGLRILTNFCRESGKASGGESC